MSDRPLSLSDKIGFMCSEMASMSNVLYAEEGKSDKPLSLSANKKVSTDQTHQDVKAMKKQQILENIELCHNPKLEKTHN